MLKDQMSYKKEILGYYVTKKGTNQKGILVLPWIDNGYYYSRPYVGMSFTNKTITDDKGNVYIPFEGIHTHPEDATPSGKYGDLGVLNNLNKYFPGMISVIINNNSYNVYNVNGLSLSHGSNYGLRNGSETLIP